MEKALIQFLSNIANLFKLKSIMSLSIIITTCVLTCKGIINVGEFLILASAIITYYFTKKDKDKEE